MAYRLGPLLTAGWAQRGAALALSALALIGVAACQQPAAGQGGATAANGAGANRLGSLPNLVGRGLQNAQDTAQAAGYYQLTSHDALGRERHQIVDRDWKVCFQTPAPGRVATATTVDLGAVKLAETCPATDQAATTPGPAGATMPNLVGKSAAVAESSLGSDASIVLKDATGRGRNVLVPSNWQVCAQQPAAGAPYNGVPVTLNVAKFTESC